IREMCGDRRERLTNVLQPRHADHDAAYIRNLTEIFIRLVWLDVSGSERSPDQDAHLMCSRSALATRAVGVHVISNLVEMCHYYRFRQAPCLNVLDRRRQVLGCECSLSGEALPRLLEVELEHRLETESQSQVRKGIM